MNIEMELQVTLILTLETDHNYFFTPNHTFKMKDRNKLENKHSTQTQFTFLGFL